MKRLLLAAAMQGASRLPLRAALSIAERFDSKIQVRLHRMSIDDRAVDPMSWGLTEYASQEGAEAGDVARARAALEGALDGIGRAGAAARFEIAPRPMRDWRELGRAARLADLSIVSREALADGASAAIEQLLFESGRPMLLAPPGWDRPVGECVAIAWNRSAETARLVGLALDLLRRAREVHVVAMEDWFVEGPDGAETVAYLAEAGVAARLRAVGKSPAEFGDRILHETAALGADLLLKGAYTQPRLAQIVFGGATRDILRDARLPVVFAH